MWISSLQWCSFFFPLQLFLDFLVYKQILNKNTVRASRKTSQTTPVSVVIKDLFNACFYSSGLSIPTLSQIPRVMVFFHRLWLCRLQNIWSIWKSVCFPSVLEINSKNIFHFWSPLVTPWMWEAEQVPFWKSIPVIFICDYLLSF